MAALVGDVAFCLFCAFSTVPLTIYLGICIKFYNFQKWRTFFNWIFPGTMCLIVTMGIEVVMISILSKQADDGEMSE